MKDELQKVLAKATPDELLRLAKLVRKSYVAQVRETGVKLDPRLLRSVDAKIKEAELQVN